MQQVELGLNPSTKWKRKREFLAEMERVVPSADLVAVIEPYAPEKRRGPPPFAVQTMLRIHFMQQWFTLSDPGMEEALHDLPLFREFPGLNYDSRRPDETTILRSRHLLEDRKLVTKILQTVNELLQAKDLLLKAGTVVVATLNATPSSTKNSSVERDSEMVSGAGAQPRTAKNGNQWHFGMKAHIGVDAQSGLVRTVRGTAANVNDVVEANSLLRSQETDAFGEAGHQGAPNRPDAKDDARWHIAMRPGKRQALDQTMPSNALLEQIEQLKASVRAKVEHPFRVIKRQFGHVKMRYRGLKKNTAQLMTLFALSNLCMGRRSLIGRGDECDCNAADSVQTGGTGKPARDGVTAHRSSGSLHQHIQKLLRPTFLKSNVRA